MTKTAKTHWNLCPSLSIKVFKQPTTSTAPPSVFLLDSIARKGGISVGGVEAGWGRGGAIWGRRYLHTLTSGRQIMSLQGWGKEVFWVWLLLAKTITFVTALQIQGDTALPSHWLDTLTLIALKHADENLFFGHDGIAGQTVSSYLPVKHFLFFIFLLFSFIL